MIVDFESLSPNQVYHTLVQTLIPRPVAWVLSDNGDGGYNLAPFSFFTGVSSRPPLIVLSIGHKPQGGKKDTWVNIEERQHFVVHIAHGGLAKEVTESSATLPHGESEVKMLGLDTAPFDGFALPRIVGPRVAYGCQRYQVIEVGQAPQGLILGRVERMFVDDSVVREHPSRLILDPRTIDPLGRLGGSDYALFGEVITIPRPA